MSIRYCAVAIVVFAATFTLSARAAITVLTGASLPTAQGWTAAFPFGAPTPSAAISNNGTFTEISTIGTTGGSPQTSGTQLFTKPVTLTTATSYQIDFTLQVLSTSGTHNQFDAPVAFGLGSLATAATRAQMIYIDKIAVGWADDSQSFALDTTSAFHTYSLKVDNTTQVAQLLVDGTPRITHAGFTTFDQIAFGDQTNDLDVNGAFRIEDINVATTPAPEPGTLGLLALITALTIGRRRASV